MGRVTYTGVRVFDGAQFRDGPLVVEDGVVAGFGAAEGHVVDLGGGSLAPGFLDLQVNGSGGLAIDKDTDLAMLETVCAIQARLGATGCLPTLITDTYDATARVVEAEVPVAAVYTIADIFEDQHYRAREMLLHIPHRYEDASTVRAINGLAVGEEDEGRRDLADLDAERSSTPGVDRFIDVLIEVVFTLCHNLPIKQRCNNLSLAL